MRPPTLRTLSNLASVASMLLFSASLAACIRSYFVSDQLLYTTQKPVIVAVAYGKGTIDFVRATFDPSIFVETPDSLAMQKPNAGWELKHEDPNTRDNWQDVPPQHYMHFLGAQYRSGQVFFFYAQDVTIPLWMLALVFAIYPGIRFLRHRRHCPGHCPTCGYDIRATPERCPECGNEPAANAAIT